MEEHTADSPSRERASDDARSMQGGTAAMPNDPAPARNASPPRMKRNQTAATKRSACADGLEREHMALMAAYGKAQLRCSQLSVSQTAENARLDAQVVRLRAAVIARDTALAWEREDRAALEATIPGLPRRIALARRVEMLLERIQGLMRERLGWQLREKAVLCIGQDDASATVTRKVVEQAGGRFLRHDGCEGIDDAALEASLVAADLVICQTGCVSHNAYWRAEDHCRRTGKQCVLVDQPDALSIVRLHRPDGIAGERSAGCRRVGRAAEPLA